MSFNQMEYIKDYNKEKYKMFQFRIKKTETEIISFLNTKNKSSYIKSLIENDIKREVYSIKEIKNIIKPIMKKYGINDIYLFGSYSRGEAKNNSDIDIYCEKGKIKSLFDQQQLEEELESALNKDIDIVFIGSKMNDFFKTQIEEDMIKLC